MSLPVTQPRIPGTARRAIPLGGVGTASASDATASIDDNSKYLKRRGQQSQKLKRSLLILFASICILVLTLWHTGTFSTKVKHPHGHHGTHAAPSSNNRKNGEGTRREDAGDGDGDDNDAQQANSSGRDDDQQSQQRRRRPRHHGGQLQQQEYRRDGRRSHNHERQDDATDQNRQEEEKVSDTQKRRQQEERRRRWQQHRHEDEEEQKSGWGDETEGDKEKTTTADHRSDVETNNNDGGNFFFSDKNNSNERHLQQRRHQQQRENEGEDRKMTLKEQLNDLNRRIHDNEDRGTVWARMDLVPSLSSFQQIFNKPLLEITHAGKRPQNYFRVARRAVNSKHTKHLNGSKNDIKKKPGKDHAVDDDTMEWERHDEETMGQIRHDFVDYTKHSYDYPDKLSGPPSLLGEYPKLMPLQEIMKIWPQDELDRPPSPIEEVLIHFDYNDPADMKAADFFREAKLPFKVINVPEVVAAGIKWTDEYISKHFDTHEFGVMTEGNAQESPSNFFSWFQPTAWNVEEMGIPPTRNNNWSYSQWAQHARYADRVGLSENQPHFYWQAGADKEERRLDPKHWTFISKDLPSFSATTRNFFLFEPSQQKGIQCRFGERGVTAATHFDGGRNMVAMMTGAKRYILSPPRECSKLGIVTTKGNAIYRHSVLNFGHINKIHDPDMPEEEREWMDEAGTSMALSTVLKAGEVLYIPSHWFHYIISLQKSAQCNVRSGVDIAGDEVFGGLVDVTDRCIPGGGRAGHAHEQPQRLLHSI